MQIEISTHAKIFFVNFLFFLNVMKTLTDSSSAKVCVMEAIQTKTVRNVPRRRVRLASAMFTSGNQNRQCDRDISAKMYCLWPGTVLIHRFSYWGIYILSQSFFHWRFHLGFRNSISSFRKNYIGWSEIVPSVDVQSKLIATWLTATLHSLTVFSSPGGQSEFQHHVRPKMHRHLFKMFNHCHHV